MFADLCVRHEILLDVGIKPTVKLVVLHITVVIRWIGGEGRGGEGGERGERGGEGGEEGGEWRSGGRGGGGGGRGEREREHDRGGGGGEGETITDFFLRCGCRFYCSV